MDAIVTVRLDKDVKESVQETLRGLGITPSRAVQLLYDYIVKTGSLPFDNDDKPSSDEIERRLAAFGLFQLDEPLQMSDDEIRAAYIKERYDFDVG